MKNFGLVLAGFLIVVGSANSQAATAKKCPKGQHWDSSMKMCMPGQSLDLARPVPVARKCAKGQHWDSGMKMCMPGKA